ncbi:hypothetical protein CASFOL_038957 [Castilleja foliolosa]|uniref:Uncharacterized protein n=1 Tax=Castilleja foliolosa TaxID=1961234 RepID=A0ABD3BIG4_9LAMI
MAGETHAREAESDNSGVTWRACNASPRAGGWAGEVAEEGASAYGGAKGLKCRSIGDDIGRRGGEEDE